MHPCTNRAHTQATMNRHKAVHTRGAHTQCEGTTRHGCALSPSTRPQARTTQPAPRPRRDGPPGKPGGARKRWARPCWVWGLAAWFVPGAVCWARARIRVGWFSHTGCVLRWCALSCGCSWWLGVCCVGTWVHGSCAVMVCTGVRVCGWLGGLRGVMCCCHWPCGLVWCMGAWLVGWLCAWVCGWLCAYGCVAGCLSGSPKNQGDFRRQIPGIFQRIFGLKISAKKNPRDFRADFRLI